MHRNEWCGACLPMRDDSSPWILFLRREKVNLFNFLLFVYLFFPSNQLDFVYFFSSSTSSNSSFEVSDSNEHLLDFVVTTVDQIDFSLYNAFESMTNRVSKILVDSYFSILITYFFLYIYHHNNIFYAICFCVFFL